MSVLSNAIPGGIVPVVKLNFAQYLNLPTAICRKTNIFDNMVAMMEKYQSHLEEIVAERTGLLLEEKKKTEGLLHRMLPKYVT